jgi:hypothetical protein
MADGFLKIWQEFGKEFASLEYPVRITVPEKIRRVEGKTAFVERGHWVTMTLAQAKNNRARLKDARKALPEISERMSMFREIPLSPPPPANW